MSDRVPSLPYDRGFAVQQMEPELGQHTNTRIHKRVTRVEPGILARSSEGRWMWRVMLYLSSVRRAGRYSVAETGVAVLTREQWRPYLVLGSSPKASAGGSGNLFSLLSYADAMISD